MKAKFGDKENTLRLQPISAQFIDVSKTFTHSASRDIYRFKRPGNKISFISYMM